MCRFVPEVATTFAARHTSFRKGSLPPMPKSKKVMSELQKQILLIRKETEDKYAEKAATEEEINRLSFTLSLYQAEKSLDESIQEKIEDLKNRISELEVQVRQIPRTIRRLEAQQRKLRANDQSPPP
jgi:chromosome segregation ATPase